MLSPDYPVNPIQNMNSVTVTPVGCPVHPDGGNYDRLHSDTQGKEANANQPADLPEVKCQSHKDMICDMFCDTCNMDICIMCTITIAGDHGDHETRNKKTVSKLF